MKDWKAIAAAKKNLKPSGTRKAGFVKGADKGEFECGNCIHQVAGNCVHPDVMADHELKHNEDGSVPVDRDDCCEYQKRPGDE